MLAGIIVVACAWAQPQATWQRPAKSSAWTQAETSAASLPDGATLVVELNSSVDTKKAKAGEKVEAHTTEAVKQGSETIVPKGAKLEGRIREATARSKGDNGSTLAIQFDKAILKKGQEIPVDVMIMAVAAPPGDSYAGSPGPGSDPMSGAGAEAAGGSPMGAARPQNPSAGIPNYPSDGAAGSATETSRRRELTASSRGVYGIRDLKLMMVDSGKSKTTVLISSGKAVRLDSGTRLLLIAQAEKGAEASK